MAKAKKDIKKVVLAYSGGLDTSIIIPWLKENYNNCEVIAVSADVGQGTELDGLEEKAIKTGASKLIVLDLKKTFVEDYIFPTVQAGALYENRYLLGTSFARPIIGKELARIALEEGADAICHGATGKGNDQVRFETSIQALDPTLEIIAPVREWDMHTRQEEMDWAEAHGVTVPTTKSKPYSIDDNLWGRAIECGVLEDPMNRPPLDIYTMTTDPEKAPEEATEIEVEFKAGLPVAIDGEQMSYLDIIAKMNQIAGANGFGRIDMIENRMIGVKSRECYEAPGALALIVAHRGLEDMCLEREVLRYKLHLEHDWATMVYNGQWFSPLRKALSAFVTSTQENVTGKVRLELYKGNMINAGVWSPYSLYREDIATFAAGGDYKQSDATGFISIYGLPTKVQAIVNNEKEGK